MKNSIKQKINRYNKLLLKKKEIENDIFLLHTELNKEFKSMSLKLLKEALYLVYPGNLRIYLIVYLIIKEIKDKLS
jgi:hypothetical protein